MRKQRAELEAKPDAVMYLKGVPATFQCILVYLTPLPLAAGPLGRPHWQNHLQPDQRLEDGLRPGRHQPQGGGSRQGLDPHISLWIKHISAVKLWHAGQIWPVSVIQFGPERFNSRCRVELEPCFRTLFHQWRTKT